MNRALFIFRRDLRLQDNTALQKALKENDEVLPCFILDKRQVERNEYKSQNLLQFMRDSLKELNESLKKQNGKLYIFYGITHDIINEAIQKTDITSVYVNRDYTPFSKERDKKIHEVCQKNNVEFKSSHDYLLNHPDKVFTNTGNPYKVFTPYWKKARKHDVPKPKQNTHTNYFNKDLDLERFKKLNELVEEDNPHIFRKGGRKEALNILQNLKKHQNYEEDRNYPWKDGTTGLSPHNKFGTVSIREVYHAMKETLGFNGLIRELYWRDFYTQLQYHFGYVYEESFKKKYNKVEWDNNKEALKAWKEGKTGFPIIDAGMRQLNKTGWMHNRVRMIVACFLTKDLHIHWKHGEKYFAQKLVDYDRSVNNGSWQWAASTGADAQPYFRIFNPWSQQKKYDKKAKYIKKYIPELQNVNPKALHKLDKQTPLGMPKKYPKPIVDHDVERKEALERYKKVV